jgi:hypothetical protein
MPILRLVMLRSVVHGHSGCGDQSSRHHAREKDLGAVVHSSADDQPLTIKVRALIVDGGVKLNSTSSVRRTQ